MKKKGPARPDIGLYRRIAVRMWGDQKFQELSPIPPCGQGLWIYLICGPYTGIIPGLLKAGRAALAESLNWPLDAFDHAYREAFHHGMVKADWQAQLVWLPNSIKYNLPVSVNVIKSWVHAWDLLPECILKLDAYSVLKSNVYRVGEPFGKAFDKFIVMPKPKPSVMPRQMSIGLPSGIQEQDAGAGAGSTSGTDKTEDQKRSGGPAGHPADVDANAKKKEEPRTNLAWNAYAAAFKKRYGVEPIRNASVNGMLANFVGRIPATDAPAVAEFYLSTERKIYVDAKHCVDLLLRDCESIYADQRSQVKRTTVDAKKHTEVSNRQAIASENAARARLHLEPMGPSEELAFLEREADASRGAADAPGKVTDITSSLLKRAK